LVAKTLGGFSDFSGFNASRANFHSLSATLRTLHANRLQVWIKATRRSVIGVGNIVSKLWAFTANFATFGHDYRTSRLNYGRFADRLRWRAIIETEFITKDFQARQARTTWAIF
jgi:hypothetical protein